MRTGERALSMRSRPILRKVTRFQGSGGVRKVRIGGRGKGKSGGYRVMVAYLGADVPAYLLTVLSKGDRANFDGEEIAAMKDFTTALKQTWRERRAR